MLDITNGELQISNLSRVEEVRLQQSHRVCKRRAYDSFVLLLSGKVDYHMGDGRSFTYTAGDVHYLPLHCGYTMDIHPEGLHYIVCDFVCPAQETRQDFGFSAKNPQIYEKLFRELALRFSAQGPERMALSLSVLFQIYGQIVRDHHPSYISGAAKKKIASVQTFLLQNLADRSLSVKQLAERAHMSEVHFRRLFHDMYGISPVKYLLAARVDRAKSLMGLSEMRLEDIAAQTGFSSTSHLCTAFKAATGLTPGQYRRRFMDTP